LHNFAYLSHIFVPSIIGIRSAISRFAHQLNEYQANIFAPSLVAGSLYFFSHRVDVHMVNQLENALIFMLAFGVGIDVK